MGIPPLFRKALKGHALTTRVSIDDQPQQLERDLPFFLDGHDNREWRESTIGHPSAIDCCCSSSLPVHSPLRTGRLCPRSVPAELGKLKPAKTTQARRLSDGTIQL